MRINDNQTNFPLAMAYVPMQQWKGMLEPETGLACGTIFQELIKPFCGQGVRQ